jgi:hypothetical protein
LQKKGMHSVLQLLFCVFIAKKDGNFMIAKKGLYQCVVADYIVTKPVFACSSLSFPFAACSDAVIFKASAAASFSSVLQLQPFSSVPQQPSA